MNEESPDVRNNSYLYEKYYYFGTVGKRKVQTIEQEKPFDYNRFKKVREEELKLSYEAFTEASGITRTDVRLIEEGRMSFRSEEHTSELQSLMRISYAVLCLTP